MSLRYWLLNLMLLSPALMLTAAGVGLTYWLVVPMEPAWGVWVLSATSFLALIGALGLAWWVKLAGAEFRLLLQHFAIHYKVPAVQTIVQLPQLNRALNERRIEHVQRVDTRANESLRITAHEIRRPLQRLSFALQLLEENCQLAAGAPEHHVIQDAMAEISNLIDEALWYARVSHGPLPLQLAYFDLRSVVDALIAEHHVLHPDRQFQCLPGGDTPQYFQADRKLFVRALNSPP